MMDMQCMSAQSMYIHSSTHAACMHALHIHHNACMNARSVFFRNFFSVKTIPEKITVYTSSREYMTFSLSLPLSGWSSDSTIEVIKEAAMTTPKNIFFFFGPVQMCVREKERETARARARACEAAREREREREKETGAFGARLRARGREGVHRVPLFHVIPPPASLFVCVCVCVRARS